MKTDSFVPLTISHFIITASNTSVTELPQPQRGSLPLPALIALIAGGVVLTLLIGFIAVFFLVRSRRKRSRREQKQMGIISSSASSWTNTDSALITPFSVSDTIPLLNRTSGAFYDEAGRYEGVPDRFLSGKSSMPNTPMPTTPPPSSHSRKSAEARSSSHAGQMNVVQHLDSGVRLDGSGTLAVQEQEIPPSYTQL